MLKTIGLNQVVFAGAMISMKHSADRINTTIDGWTSMGEKSDVFEEYVQQFGRLQIILKNYQLLVKSDIEKINKIGDRLVETDQLLTKLWK